ncbi:hypothetical protein GF420_00880 [candidate division GN15 bacterium]|nr:hypothetical protein [candidate division GN15 bacterium]
MLFLLTAILVSPVIAGAALAQETTDKPFGGEKDVSFADKVWKQMDGYNEWRLQTDYYEGTRPHGAILRTYYSMISVDDTPFHVIVKENYGGEGATMETVADSPGDYLKSVTVMVQRKPGYDEANNNWFWVKYAPDGSIMENEKGMALAGRVAKGMDAGCIACHATAGGNDYVFTNDD